MKYKPLTEQWDHQRSGLKWTFGRKGRGGYLWEPGTGKSKAAIDFASAAHLAGKLHKVLILCPINALGVWPDQIEKHSPVEYTVWEPYGKIADKADQIRTLIEDEEYQVEGVQYLILNYDAVIKRDTRWLMMKWLEKWKPDLVVFDESQKIKNPTTKRAKAAHKLAHGAQYCLILTGTPIGRNLLDLYSQIKAVDPLAWETWPGTGETMSWTAFKNTYAVFGGVNGFTLKRFVNVDDLNRRYQPHVRSVRKVDCLDLPKVTDEVIPVELTPAQYEAYETMAEDGVLVYKHRLIDAPIPLTKLLRLKQMAGGWVHDEHGEVVEFQTEKLDVFKSLMEDLREADEKVVVFGLFLAELDAIRDACDTELVIRGGVTDQRRRSMVRHFQSSREPEVLAVQVNAAEALDGLQNACAYGVYYSKDHGLIGYEQSRGRLDRGGQRRPVTFYHLEVNRSADKLVASALRDKKNLEKMVMDHPEVLLVHRRSE